MDAGLSEVYRTEPMANRWLSLYIDGEIKTFEEALVQCIVAMAVDVNEVRSAALRALTGLPPVFIK